MSIRACLLTSLWLSCASVLLVAQPDTQSPPAGVAALERHFERVVEAAAPSVVKVIATAPRGELEKDPSGGGGESRGAKTARAAATVARSISVSGLLIDRAGHIAVPADPFDERSRVFVTVQIAPRSYRQFRARLVGRDPSRNVAVIRLLFPTADLRPIAVGDPARLRPGSFILGVGWPYRFPVSCSFGIVGGVNREIWIGKRRFAGLLMTTATVHPGESGGALLDVRGRVVGMLMSALDPAAEGRRGRPEERGTDQRGPRSRSASITFAVPIDTVLSAVRAICARHPAEGASENEAARFLGVKGTYLLEANPLSSHLGLATGRGFVVSQVFEGEAAQRGGVCRHDVILQIGDVAIQGSGYSILTALEKAPFGQDVGVVVMRKGRRTKLALRFEPRARATSGSSSVPERKPPNAGSGAAGTGSGK